MEKKETLTPSPDIKMLVIDIDGTLLNPDGAITPRTRTAVQAAQEAGIIVTLATARRFGNTINFAAELGIDIPLILYDGAMIVKYPEGIILHTYPLQAAIAQQAVDIMARQHVQPVVHPSTGLAEEIWTGPEDFDDLLIEAYFATFPEQMHRMPFETLCAGHPDPIRVVAFTSEEAIAQLIPAIAALECSWTTIKRGSYGSAELEVKRAGCSKAGGVAALARLHGIPMEQVMAIGDNNNDIEMLQTAGWGVAMGQAPTLVKASARAVTASNREDGAAQAIERYALCNTSTLSSNSLKRTTCR